MFNSANFSLLSTSPLTGLQTFEYDAGSDDASLLQQSSYFPTSIGANKGDVIASKCSHNGVAGKIMYLEVANVDSQVHPSQFYKNF